MVSKNSQIIRVTELYYLQNKTQQEIAKEIGVDSLGYLSVEATHHLASESSCGFCDGCFTGHYPVDPPAKSSKSKFEQKLSQNSDD